MPAYDYKFRTISEYNYTHSTPTLWQAWHEAYFRRITGVLHADGEHVRLFESGCTTDSWTARVLSPSYSRAANESAGMSSRDGSPWSHVGLLVNDHRPWLKD
ncbi:hypothetical protein FALCPG4_017572 [Fusarium falciforme]